MADVDKCWLAVHDVATHPTVLMISMYVFAQAALAALGLVMEVLVLTIECPFSDLSPSHLFSRM